jgi:hypothetical protein
LGEVVLRNRNAAATGRSTPPPFLRSAALRRRCVSLSCGRKLSTAAIVVYYEQVHPQTVADETNKIVKQEKQ